MKYPENKKYRFIKKKSEIANKMKRTKEVFELYNSGYTSKEIAKIMRLPIEMIRFWIGSTYFYILEKKTKEDPVQRDDNSLWLDNIIYSEMNRRLEKKKKQKNKKKLLKKAS